MRIYSVIVYQEVPYRESGKLIIDESRSAWREHAGPVAECKPKASPAENQAFTDSAQDKAGRDANIAATQNDVSGQEGDLSFYSGDPTKSPMYNAYVNKGTSAVNSAYNNAAANTKQSANAAGFGYAQPATQGANAEVEAQRGQALSAVPGDALMKTASTNLQAAGLRANLANTRSQQSGYYNPTGYFNTGAQMQQNRLNSSGGMWGTLANLGMQGAGMGLKAASVGGFCWIAEAIYGVDDPRTRLARAWISGDFSKTKIGSLVVAAYKKYGERVAKLVSRSRLLRAMFRPLFDRAVSNAIGSIVPASRLTLELREPDFESVEYQR